MNDAPDSYDNAWRCKDCRKQYVVPGLARDCEARHAAEPAIDTASGRSRRKALIR